MCVSHIFQKAGNVERCRSAQSRPGMALLLGVWGVLLLIGFGALEVFKATPGAQGLPLLSGLGSELKSGKAAIGPLRLQLFIHAYCPCTRATLAELGRVMQAVTVPVTVDIVVVQPPENDADWRNGLAAEAASLLPDAAILLDAKGLIAAQVGALTSGHVVLSDDSGRVLFRGGITAARGHEGENEGRKALLAWTQGRRASVSQSPVFGCAFAAPGSDARGIDQE